MKHLASFSGGKDSTAMVLQLIERGDPLDDIIFFDTGWEFPQMYEHINKVEEYLDRRITRLYPKRSFHYWLLERPVVAIKGPNKGNIHRIGSGWPSPFRRWCTRIKVNTVNNYCGDGVIQYIGIAANETKRLNRIGKDRTKWKQRKSSTIFKYPLNEWGMKETDNLSYCYDRGFTWSGLYDLFPRLSCFCCPLQRIGQLRNLRRNFPDLWEKMLDWDLKMGEGNRGFRNYETVQDLEKRFSSEDQQQYLF
jgi:3'-phosphoadenosine 5'-phosphosulfate sulfotransferase (PAPS reductase)/FAD synthetase